VSAGWRVAHVQAGWRLEGSTGSNENARDRSLWRFIMTISQCTDIASSVSAVATASDLRRVLLFRRRRRTNFRLPSDIASSGSPGSTASDLRRWCFFGFLGDQLPASIGYCILRLPRPDCLRLASGAVRSASPATNFRLASKFASFDSPVRTASSLRRVLLFRLRRWPTFRLSSDLEFSGPAVLATSGLRRFLPLRRCRRFKFRLPARHQLKRH